MSNRVPIPSHAPIYKIWGHLLSAKVALSAIKNYPCASNNMDAMNMKLIASTTVNALKDLLGEYFLDNPSMNPPELYLLDEGWISWFQNKPPLNKTVEGCWINQRYSKDQGPDYEFVFGLGFRLTHPREWVTLTQEALDLGQPDFWKYPKEDKDT